MWRMKFDPMNPAPPVTKSFILRHRWKKALASGPAAPQPWRRSSYWPRSARDQVGGAAIQKCRHHQPSRRLKLRASSSSYMLLTSVISNSARADGLSA
jgi:hypothetical protein